MIRVSVDRGRRFLGETSWRVVSLYCVIIAGICGPRVSIADNSSARDNSPSAKNKHTSKTLSCWAALRGLGVKAKRAHAFGVTDAVEIPETLGAVTYRGYGKQKTLIIDCSLALSLAIAAPYFAAQGITRVRYSSAYQRRFIRGTKRLSRHSFGLAIDLHTFSGDELGTLTVRDDYEQGLGDNSNCLGDPLTENGLILRKLWCQLSSSKLFRIILDPDFDADHYNHFHVEALPWSERTDRSLIKEQLIVRAGAR